MNRRQQQRVRRKTLGMRRTRREAPPDDDAAEQIVTKLLKMKAGEHGEQVADSLCRARPAWSARGSCTRIW